MFILPEYKSEFKNNKLEKISSYLELVRLGFPVLKSILITEINDLSNIKFIKDYFSSDFCTLRYQYICTCKSPIRGGNIIKINYDLLKKEWNNSYYLWLLEPTNRTSNLYNINITYFPNNREIVLEILGKGFDISDLNRGDIYPHQIIKIGNILFEDLFENKFKFSNNLICNAEEYRVSIKKRIKKLQDLNFNISIENFNIEYKPCPTEILNKILIMVKRIVLANISKHFTVSSSILADGRMVFWDIQKDTEKIKRFIG